MNNTSVVNAVLKAVGYTYGPILGLFTFGLMTEYQVKGKFLPWICSVSYTHLPGSADEFRLLTDAVGGKGYRQIDINLGCPFPMIAGKHKGAGMLLDVYKRQPLYSKLTPAFPWNLGSSSPQMTCWAAS